jgi:hypothetical protein
VSVKGEKSYVVSKFFDSTSTNEVSGAPASNAGLGTQKFELQTSLEAPHLGCGAIKNDGMVQDCWLVIVPRGEFSLDGKGFQDSAGNRISGSPLSASNWANRVEVPLDFKSVVSGCDIGVAEQRTVGNDSIGPAFTSWQAFLCRDTATFGFSQIGDGEARRQVLSDLESAARLGFVAKPIDGDTAGSTRLLYAPVAAIPEADARSGGYREYAQADEIKRYGQEQADAMARERVAKLAALKQSIIDEDFEANLDRKYQNQMPDPANQP